MWKSSLKNCWSRACLPFFIFSFISILVFFPLLQKGFVFLLDWQVPHISGNPGLFPPNFIRWFFSFADFIHLPLWLSEKFFFILLTFLSGIGMYRLTPGSIVGKTFSGLYYTINPFIYSRFFFGQMTIVTAYALMPFFLYALFRYIEYKSIRQGVVSLVLLAFIIGTSLHAVYFVALLFFTTFLAYLLSRCPILFKDHASHSRSDVSFLLFTGFVVSVIVAGALFWYPRSTATLSSIQWNDFIEFRTATDMFDYDFSSAAYVASLHGFWGERDGRYVLAKDVVPGWWWWHGVFISIVTLGIVYFFREWHARYRRSEEGVSHFLTFMPLQASVYFGLGIISFILALGLGTSFTETLTRWLFEHLPFYKGFRDTQKWQAVFVVSLSYFGGLGVTRLFYYVKKIRGNTKRFLGLCGITIVIGMPIVAFPLMFGGFAGQLSVSSIPAGWVTVKEVLQNDTEEFRVLFLPWHQYLPLQFTQNRVVQNPALWFFGGNIIAGDNEEKGSIFTKSTRLESRIVEGYFFGKGPPEEQQLTTMLNRLGVKYVILALEYDYVKYMNLLHDNDLELLFQDHTISVFLNPTFSTVGKE